MSIDERRDGVELTNLDQPLFEGARASKRDLVDYLDAVSDRIIPVLRDRPLSVIRATRGQAPFMQKNLPKHAPDWIAHTDLWADTSQRVVSYALCNDRQTLLWFANQRAVEYHPTLTRADRLDHATNLVIDLDPPAGADFAMVVRAAKVVRDALGEIGLVGALKTSGAKGLHVFVPVDVNLSMDDAAAATRAIARRAEMRDPESTTTAFLKADRGGKVFLDATRTGGATVAAAYSPRARPGVPVSFPVAWDDLDAVTPGEFTIHTAIARLGGTDPWAESLPAPQQIPVTVLTEGRDLPIPRVAAMHEGKRRARFAKQPAPSDDEARSEHPRNG